ncbi:hypothetical protein BVRB_5g098120 [Beta vulgaris subsp. vulgaris]|uniref:uncharacterized protein LOC104892073 n=1 Tax=Beta vulgaris subsp. vulgaris TaxID=3555 RepID=UPI00053FBA04|nr:uncharacterized protein LOC104892073 [Beta vulgaris subsp. vulgaris]KMT12567.1 hypothetical protein BVRB_5g098120 [Beta vulgaris subsp. vulgaris]
MKTYVGMEVMMMVGIVLFMSMQFMPSSAQDSSFCWNRIMTCRQGAHTPPEFREVCCPVFTQIITNETPCFCSIQPNLNATDVDGISMLLSLCNVGATFDTICPGGTSQSPQQAPSSPPQSAQSPTALSPGPNSSPSVTPAAPTPGSSLSPSPSGASPAAEPASSETCWEEIGQCLTNNVNSTEPQFDTSSPSFNVTEFFCCPLIQESARNEKQCFCTMNTVITQDPSLAPNVTQLLGACGIADSVASLNSFCQGEAPTPSLALTPSLAPTTSLAPPPSVLPPNVAPTTMMPPLGEEGPSAAPGLMTPPPGSAESPMALGPVANGDNTDSFTPEGSAANKIAMAGSFSSLLVLSIYLLF